MSSQDLHEGTLPTDENGSPVGPLAAFVGMDEQKLQKPIPKYTPPVKSTVSSQSEMDTKSKFESIYLPRLIKSAEYGPTATATVGLMMMVSSTMEGMKDALLSAGVSQQNLNALEFTSMMFGPGEFAALEEGMAGLMALGPQAKGLLADTRGSIGALEQNRLPIVNPYFESSIAPQEAFQGATELVFKRLSENPKLIMKSLTPQELETFAQNPWKMQHPYFGNAVERSLAKGAESTGLLIHTGETTNRFVLGGADFVGKTGTSYAGLEFQVTTYGQYLRNHLQNSPSGTIFGLYPGMPR